MSTTAPNVPLIWTAAGDEQGVRLDYRLHWKNGDVSTGYKTCLQPGQSVTVASNTGIASTEVIKEDIRKRPKVAVTVGADPPEAAQVSGGLELWCKISGISCTQVTTTGSVTLTYDRAKWVLNSWTTQTRPPSWSSGPSFIDENTIEVYFSGGRTEYSAGGVHPEKAVIPFLKTREVVTVNSSTGGRASVSPDPLPEVEDVPAAVSGYEWGTAVTLSAGTPDDCYEFDHWEYTGSGSDPHGIHGSRSSVVTLTALPNYKREGYSGYQIRESSYKAVYSKKQVQAAVLVSPPAAAVAPAPETLDCGSAWHPLAPLPESECDYRFDHWSDGETERRHSWVYPTSDIALTAVYTRIDHQLSVDVRGDGAGSYSVSPQQSTYHYGDVVYLTVNPNAPCSYLSGVYGADPLPDGRYKITMDACSSSHTKSVTIYLYKHYYRITTSVSPEGGGTVTPSSASYVPCGEYRTLTAAPAECHRFLRWSTGSTDPEIRVLVDADKALTAYFQVLPVDDHLLCARDGHRLLFTRYGGNLLWAGCDGADPESEGA